MRYSEEGGAQNDIATLNAQYQTWSTHFHPPYSNIRVIIKLEYQRSNPQCIVVTTLRCSDSDFSEGFGQHCHKRRIPRSSRLCARSVRVPSTMGCNLMFMWSLKFAVW